MSSTKTTILPFRLIRSARSSSLSLRRDGVAKPEVVLAVRSKALPAMPAAGIPASPASLSGAASSDEACAYFRKAVRTCLRRLIGSRSERAESNSANSCPRSSSRFPIIQGEKRTIRSPRFLPFFLSLLSARLASEDFPDPHSPSMPTTRPPERSLRRKASARWRASLRKPSLSCLRLVIGASLFSLVSSMMALGRNRRVRMTAVAGPGKRAAGHCRVGNRRNSKMFLI